MVREAEQATQLYAAGQWQQCRAVCWDVLHGRPFAAICAGCHSMLATEEAGPTVTAGTAEVRHLHLILNETVGRMPRWPSERGTSW